MISQTEENFVEKDDEGNEYNTNPHNELWESDPKCLHHITLPTGGGIRCSKCGGWFCF